MKQTHTETPSFLLQLIGPPSLILTCLPHLVFTVSQQFKDVHLQLASGGAVCVPVDAVFGQRDGQSLSSAALHRVVKDGS